MTNHRSCAWKCRRTITVAKRWCDSARAPNCSGYSRVKTALKTPLTVSGKFGLSEQSGAVLIILIVLVVALLFLASLAVDTGVISASRTQHRQTSELIALRALREYTSAAGSPMTKLLTARAKAQDLVGIDVIVGQPFRANPGLADEIGPMDSSLTSGESGNIVPGIWHFRPEVDSAGVCVGSNSGCPCTPSREWNGPCFEEIRFNDASNYVGGSFANGLLRSINAFRAEYRLRADSPLQAIFSRLGGAQATELRSNSTAALVPTHGVFLVDLSRSSHIETHVPYERVGKGNTQINPNEEALQLQNVSCPVDNTNPCVGGGPQCRFAGGIYPDTYGQSPDNPGLYSDVYNAVPSIIKLSRASVPAAPRTFRYKSDYSCYEIDYGGGLTENYLVDTYRGPTKNNTEIHDGPEPLTTMIDGVSRALEHIYNRNIPGDRIGFIGFDETTDLTKRRVDPVFVDTAEYRKLHRLTDISLADQDSDHDGTADLAAERMRDRIKEMLLFTRTDAAANIPSALDQARIMLLNNTDSQLAEKFVALISDGLANCIPQAGGKPMLCGADQNTHVVPSINKSIQLVQDEFVPARIKFHMISIGDITLPHTLLRKGLDASTAQQCLTDDEARANNEDFIDPGPDPALNPDLLSAAALDPRTPPPNLAAPYFYYPNRFYEAVRSTGGVWVPIKQPCAPSADVALPAATTCGQGGLKQALDEKCAAQGSSGATVPNLAGFTDAAGRLGCDIYCRSRRDQVRAAVDSMFERPPLILVE